MSWQVILFDLFQLFIYPGIIFLIALALFYQWVDRRVYARAQNRYGPHHTGPKGILQPLADMIKLLAKEDIEPSAVDKMIFRSVPILFLSLMFTALFIIPIAGIPSVVSFEGDLIFLIFMMTIFAVLAFLAGWGSTNRFSLVGGMRAALQTLGYEVPLAISFIGPAILAGTLSVSNIAAWQVTNGFWGIILNPIGFGIVIIGIIAVIERVPFDIPEAETEIVAGWQTEFSGRKLGLLRLAHDLEVVFVSGLVVALFLGGPTGPISLIPGIIWFIIKTIVIVFIIAYIRAQFARFRIDQMVGGSWKYLVPLSILQIIILQLYLMI